MCFHSRAMQYNLCYNSGSNISSVYGETHPLDYITHTLTTPTLSEHIGITIPALPFSDSTAWQSTIQPSVLPPSFSADLLNILLLIQTPCKLCWMIPVLCTFTLFSNPYLMYPYLTFFSAFEVWNQLITFKMKFLLPTVLAALLKWPSAAKT